MNAISLIKWLYPDRCPVCGRIPPKQALVCPKCRSRISFVKQPSCYRCGKPLLEEETEYCHDCMAHPKSFRQGFALAVYDAVTAPSLAAIKYKNRRQYLEFYIQESARTYGQAIKDIAPNAILPVPIHAKRLKTRGFNQAALLAKGLGHAWQIPVYEDLLVRKVNTAPQKNLSPALRTANLKKAFALYPGYEDAKLPFPKVLLVDDIYTTGATVEALSQILMEHGVKEVYVFCICIGQGY